LNQRFGNIVTDAATGTRHKNPLGGHSSVQNAGRSKEKLSVNG
jgi:hypothetical protein